MKTLWQEVDDIAGPGGRIGLTIRGDEISRRCIICDKTFPQTDEGWIALKTHGFEEHEQIMPYDWRELHGKSVTIGVVEREEEVSGSYGEWLKSHGGNRQTELIAKAEDGTIYFLPFSHYDSAKNGGFKCKPKSQGSNLLRLMQPEAESQSKT